MVVLVSGSLPQNPSSCIVCHVRCVTVPVCGCLPRNLFHTLRSFRSAAVSSGSSHAQGEVASITIGGFWSAAVSRGFRLQSPPKAPPNGSLYPFPFTSAHRTHTLVDSSWWFWSAAVSRRTSSSCTVCHVRCFTVPVCGCLPRNQFHTVRSFWPAAVSRGSSHA